MPIDCFANWEWIHSTDKLTIEADIKRTYQKGPYINTIIRTTELDGDYAVEKIKIWYDVNTTILCYKAEDTWIYNKDREIKSHLIKSKCRIVPPNSVGEYVFFKIISKYYKNKKSANM